MVVSSNSTSLNSLMDDTSAEKIDKIDKLIHPRLKKVFINCFAQQNMKILYSNNNYLHNMKLMYSNNNYLHQSLSSSYHQFIL